MPPASLGQKTLSSTQKISKKKEKKKKQWMDQGLSNFLMQIKLNQERPQKNKIKKWKGER